MGQGREYEVVAAEQENTGQGHAASERLRVGLYELCALDQLGIIHLAPGVPGRPCCRHFAAALDEVLPEVLQSDMGIYRVFGVGALLALVKPRDRKSTRLTPVTQRSRMPSSA